MIRQLCDRFFVGNQLLKCDCLTSLHLYLFKDIYNFHRRLPKYRFSCGESIELPNLRAHKSLYH